MNVTITESRLTKILHTYLTMSFEGFDNCYYNWAEYNCGMGVCCDPYAVEFSLPDSIYGDHLFKLIDSENYSNSGNYPKELMDELPEPCYDLPDITESRFDTLWLGEELTDQIVPMFGGFDVWGKSFLKIFNEKYKTNVTQIV
jgi:hypothetical protein